MKDMLGWILAAAGVYIIYEKFIAPASAAPSGTTIVPGTTPTQNSTNPSTSVANNTTSPGSITVGAGPLFTQDQMVKVQQFSDYLDSNQLKGSIYNTDQWNYYWAIATGQAGPAPESMGVSPRNATMGYTDYLNLMGRWLNGVTSLNGIPGYTGIGLLVPANYTRQHPTGRDYRSNGINRPSATPTGWEVASKFKN